MQRACLRSVIAAQYAGEEPPPVRASLAALFASTHANGSEAFRAGYQAACRQLLSGLGAPASPLANPNAYSAERVAFGVTEAGGVRPADMQTTLEADGSACRVKGNKAFVAEDATEVLIIAKPLGALAERPVATITQPGTRLPPKPHPQLLLATSPMAPHRFERHAKPLPFLRELGPQGSVVLDGPASAITTSADDTTFVDGTAALLGFRDVEDVHIAVAFAGHICRAVLSSGPDGTVDHMNPSDERVMAAEQLRAAALAVAAVVDDAWSEIDPGAGVGSRGGFPILFSPLARVHSRAALASVRAAVERAVAVEGGVPAELARDVQALGIAQKVRDARWRNAIRDLQTSS